MERAAAVMVGGIGLVLLVLAALAVVGHDPERSDGGGVDLAVVATTAPLAGATVLGARTSLPGGTEPAPATATGPPTSASRSADPVAGPAPGTSASPPAAPPAPSSATTSVSPPSPSTVTSPAVPPAPSAPPPELVEAARLVSDGGVRFAVGRSDLDHAAMACLVALAAQLRARPDVAVLVVGHTDSTGGDDVNRPLSQRRAQVVIEFLVGQGVDPAQLRAEGVGPDRPAADNASPAGRQANRRSEVSVESAR